MTVEEIQSETKSKIHGLIILGLLLFFIGMTTYSIDPALESYKPYIFGVLVSLLLIGMVGIGHNFIHHKQNVFKYFLTATGFTHN